MHLILELLEILTLFNTLKLTQLVAKEKKKSPTTILRYIRKLNTSFCFPLLYYSQPFYLY